VSEYREKRTIVQEAPPVGGRPVLETRYDSVVHERPGLSGVAVAALVLGAIAVAVVITVLIINSQQKNTDEALMQQRANNAAAPQQMPAQPAEPPAVIVNVPAAQAAAPPPVLAPPPTAPALSSVDVEMAVVSKLQADQELRFYAVDAKVSGGTTTLSGYVQNDGLKARAERVARTVTGVRSIINNITVEP